MTSNFSLHLFRYLREVGFPDNVLEARVARMTAYKNLYGQNQLIEQPHIGNRSESPQPTVSYIKLLLLTFLLSWGCQWEGKEGDFDVVNSQVLVPT